MTVNYNVQKTAAAKQIELKVNSDMTDNTIQVAICMRLLSQL